MVRKFNIDGGVNDYAEVIEPSQEEVEELVNDGYVPFSFCTIENKDSEYYGKTQQLWLK